MPSLSPKADPKTIGTDLENLARQAESVRELIIGEENLELLSELRLHLRDSKIRTTELSKDLPNALVHRAEGDESEYNELVSSLVNPVEKSLDASVDLDKAIMGRTLAPAFGGMLIGYVSELSRQLSADTDTKIRNLTSPNWWIAKITGKQTKSQSYLREIIVIELDNSDILVHLGGIGPSAQTISDLGRSANQLLDYHLSEEEDTPLRGISFTDLTQEVSGMAIQGQHCLVLGITSKVRSPELGPYLQQVCDSTDTILAPTQIGEKWFPASGEQRELVLACVEQVYEETAKEAPPEEPQKSPLKWILFGFLSLILIATAFFAWSKIRWASTIALLEEEPGIRVLEHSHGFGGHQIHILSDPLATPASHLIETQGYSTENVNIVSSYFLSQHETIQGIRSASLKLEQAAEDQKQKETIVALVDEATLKMRSDLESDFRDRELLLLRSLLQLSPTVSLSHQQDRVIAEGEIGTSDLENLERAIRQLTWVKTIDFSGLIPSPEESRSSLAPLTPSSRSQS